jgi:hypothetical protein
MAIPIPHGSSLPGTLEGAPFHNDSFLLSFNAIANVNGTAIYIGALVTLATTADFTCEVVAATVTGGFLLGIAQTSGQLNAAIDVICRGEVTVLCDATVTAGQYLDVSATTDGYVAPIAGPTRLIALQGGTYVATPLPIVALLF